MAVSKKHQWSDERYVTSDKSGQFPPKVRRMCGYHTLVYTNYLEAQARTRDERQLHELSDMLQQNSAHKLVKSSRHLSCGDRKGAWLQTFG